jgi:hypothetical protein
VLGAAAALHAGVGLQADQLGEVGAGDQAEVFIAGERGNLAEAAAGKKDGGRAEHQVQVLGVRNERQKRQQGVSVCAHQRIRARRGRHRRQKNEAR